MRRVLCIASLAACLALGATNALGWGSDGHQTVGAIADQMIAGTPTAKHVRKILGSTLRTASVWADCAKGVTQSSDGTFKYTVNPIYTECKPFENAASKKVMI